MRKLLGFIFILIFVLSVGSAFAKDANELQYDDIQPGKLVEPWLIARITDQIEAHFIKNPSYVYEVRPHYITGYGDTPEIAGKRALQVYEALRQRGIPCHALSAVWDDDSVSIVIVGHPPVGIGKGEARTIAREEADRAVKKVTIPHLGIGPSVMALGVEGEGFVLPGASFDWRSTYRLRLGCDLYITDNDFAVTPNFGVEAIRANLSDEGNWKFLLVPRVFGMYLIGSLFDDNNAALTATGGGAKLDLEFAYVTDGGSFGLSLVPSVGGGLAEWRQNENPELRIYPDWDQVSQHPFLLGTFSVMFRF